MIILVSVLCCFIPLVVFFVCFWILEKEFSPLHGLIAVLLGIVAVIPIAAIQFFAGGGALFTARTLVSILLSALVVNGLIEEAFKMLLLFALPAKRTRLKVFFFYAMLSGFALGCFESLLYLISGLDSIGLRMVTAVVMHSLCAGLLGLFVFSVKRRVRSLLPFFMAVVLHGVYNYFAGFGTHSLFFYGSIVAILLAAIECRVRYIKIRQTLHDIHFSTIIPDYR